MRWKAALNAVDEIGHTSPSLRILLTKKQSTIRELNVKFEGESGQSGSITPHRSGTFEPQTVKKNQSMTRARVKLLAVCAVSFGLG